MDLTGISFDAARGHHSWTPGGVTLLNEGSAYLQTLNNTPSGGAQSVSQANPAVTVRSGQIVTQNYEYRSGKRTVVIP